MKRPQRKDYPIGIYGDIGYGNRLEKYTSYLENRLNEHKQALSQHDVSGSLPLTERADYITGWNDGIVFSNNGKSNDH